MNKKFALSVGVQMLKRMGVMGVAKLISVRTVGSVLEVANDWTTFPYGTST